MRQMVLSGTKRWLLAVLLVLLTFPMASPSGAVVKVAVSIKPLHSLVAGVMDGVAEATLIFTGGGSPHGAGFKPSQMRIIRESALIIWIGEGMEPALARALESTGMAANGLSAVALAGMKRWPSRRRGDLWDSDSAGNDKTGAVAPRSDPHLWLDTGNAAIIVRAVAGRLAAMDRANAARYRANEGRMLRRLAELTAALEKIFAPVRGRRYVVHHDAYQYLEKQFALRPLGAISFSENRLPGPRRLSQLRLRMAQAGARCVFTDPQSGAALARALAGPKGRVVELDVLGLAVPPGRSAYFRTMTNMTAAMAGCLAGGN